MSALPFIYHRPGHARHNQPCEAYFPNWTDKLCYVQFGDGEGMGATAKQVLENPRFGEAQRKS
ncbi:MAG TPA: hypothetical protein GXX48_01965 [Ochrobactrum intermedium]|uniref:Uncharacterized protein n=1 Tax=Brucella intermedia TaxID=94625 RepID=A0A7V6P8Q9_9HYPH|nr:hypothetical protein [Brucella intermedia]HHV66406.1 hypothetical protein [Brucella intermedia]